MRRKQPPIDIAQSVMQRIERDGISMRSKRYFTIRNIGRKVGLSAAVIFSLLGVTSLAYTLRNDVFNDYIDLASQARYINSLPWAGIVVTVVSIGLVVLSVRAIARQNQNFKLSYAFVVWFVLIIGSVGFAFSLSPKQTPSILARIAFVSDKDPSKIYGAITEILGGNSFEIQVEDKTFVVYANTSGLKVGDKILVIGGRKNNNIYAAAVKLVESAPKPRQEEKKAEQIIETPKPEEPAKEEPNPVTTITPAPKPTPTPTPIPTPISTPEPTPDPEPGIYIISKIQNETNITITYMIYPSLDGKCKTTLKKSPKEITSNYDFYENPTSTCINVIPKSSLSPGVWTGIVYWRFPYNDWSKSYSTSFTVEVTP